MNDYDSGDQPSDPFKDMYDPEAADLPVPPPLAITVTPVSFTDAPAAPVVPRLPVTPAAGGMPLAPPNSGGGVPTAAPVAAPVAAPALTPVPTALHKAETPTPQTGASSVPVPVPVPVPMPVPAATPTATAYEAAKTPGGPVLPSAASTPGVAPVENPEDEERIVLDELLIHMVEKGGSDLHLSAGSPPVIRVRGEMQAIKGYPSLTPKMLLDTMYSVMTSKHRATFEEKLELDFAYTVPGQARFRVNVMKQRGAVGAVMRTIPWEILSLEALNLPEMIGDFADLPRGFVLVTGPTGSGKSTTLAAIIDRANRTRSGHIITIEDPVEFLHQHRGCVVNQREVGDDTHSFRDALKHVLRQDPDIILVGELRDLETISVALTAAETGHLVFATLHTQSAQETVTRIIDVFPPEQQQQVRTQLAASLQGVVCQTLCKTADGNGRQAAVEIMVATPNVRALVRESKLQQIQGALQSGGKHGMQTLNQDLAKHVISGRITYDTGLEKSSDKEDFQTLVGPREAIEQAARQRAAQQASGNGAMAGFVPPTAR